MKVSIVIAAVIANPELLRLTKQCLESLRSDHDFTTYLLINRLDPIYEYEITKELSDLNQGTVNIYVGPERSVAASWNYGIQEALIDRSDYILVCGNDTVLQPHTIDVLVRFGEKPTSKNVSLWCGYDLNSHTQGSNDQIDYDQYDCSCFMIRPWTIVRHGFFDENFCPAYFEDNDYCARIVLGGGEVAIVQEATYFHYESMTIKLDQEIASHHKYTFGQNRFYFETKWGVAKPSRQYSGIMKGYYKSPWNVSDRNLNWWPPL